MFTFIFQVLLLVSYFFLGSLSFFSKNFSFRKFLVINCLISRISPLFLLYNYLDLCNILNTPLDLFETLTLILNSYSSLYTNYFPQRLTHLLPRITNTVTDVVYPAVTTRWSETHQGQCEEHSRMPQNLLPTYPIHGPCTLLLQSSIHLSYPQDSTTFLLHPLKVFFI